MTTLHKSVSLFLLGISTMLLVGCGIQNDLTTETPETTFIDLNTIAGDVFLTEAGHYVLQGTLTDGGIIVNVPETEIILTLNGVNITNPKGPALLFQTTAASRVILAENTENYLEDGAEEREYDATLYSVASLTIEGEGALHIIGHAQEGICSEMHLTINDGTISIQSLDDGLNANNDGVSTITINGGKLTIDADGDGIDSNGSITINGGNIIATSKGGNGGIDADGDILINGGDIIAL
jgi:hypothetical protein